MLTAIGLGAAILVTAWRFAPWVRNRSGPTANATMVIAPYSCNGTWVFDDPDAGLKRDRRCSGITHPHHLSSTSKLSQDSVEDDPVEPRQS